VQIGDVSVEHPYIVDSRVVPFFVVSVFVREGIIESLQFDDTTSQCHPDHIIGTSCSFATSSCNEVDCSPKVTECPNRLEFPESLVSSCFTDQVYVGWIGSDSNGVILKSAELRPSNFLKFSGAGAFRNIASVL
jgi:hypothetical protein